MNESSPTPLHASALPDGGPVPPCLPTQHEVFGTAEDGSATAFALHQAMADCRQHAPRWLWVQDRQAMVRSGRPFVHGLPPRLQGGLVHVAASKAEDALFALEEGLRCRDFAFVVGELAGDPRALDFTASRRLSLASERHGVALYLIRIDGFANLSAARRRWRIAAAPATPSRWDDRAAGSPRWQAELFRARDVPCGQWTGSGTEGWHSGKAGDGQSLSPHPVDLAAAAGDRPVAAFRAA